MNGQFGRSVALVDINADGQLDLAVGSPSADSPLLQYHGAVYVYLGRSAADQPPLSSRPNVILQCTVRNSLHHLSAAAITRGAENPASGLCGSQGATGTVLLPV